MAPASVASVAGAAERALVLLRAETAGAGGAVRRAGCWGVALGTTRGHNIQTVHTDQLASYLRVVPLGRLAAPRVVRGLGESGLLAGLVVDGLPVRPRGLHAARGLAPVRRAAVLTVLLCPGAGRTVGAGARRAARAGVLAGARGVAGRVAGRPVVVRSIVAGGGTSGVGRPGAVTRRAAGPRAAHPHAGVSGRGSGLAGGRGAALAGGTAGPIAGVLAGLRGVAGVLASRPGAVWAWAIGAGASIAGPLSLVAGVSVTVGRHPLARGTVAFVHVRRRAHVGLAGAWPVPGAGLRGPGRGHRAVHGAIPFTGSTGWPRRHRDASFPGLADGWRHGPGAGGAGGRGRGSGAGRGRGPGPGRAS